MLSDKGYAIQGGVKNFLGETEEVTVLNFGNLLKIAHQQNYLILRTQKKIFYYKLIFMVH